MKKILLVLIILIASSLHAQKIKFTLSDKFEFRQEEGQAYKIGNSFYRMDLDMKGPQFAFTAKLSKATHAITLYKYDANMNQIKKLELEGGKKNFGPFTSRLINFN